MRPKRAANRRPSGLSLLEMMVATAIMATLMTSVVVVMRSGFAVWKAQEADLLAVGRGEEDLGTGDLAAQAAGPALKGGIGIGVGDGGGFVGHEPPPEVDQGGNVIRASDGDGCVRRHERTPLTDRSRIIKQCVSHKTRDLRWLLSV